MAVEKAASRAKCRHERPKLKKIGRRGRQIPETPDRGVMLMANDLQSRIDATYSRDRLWAWGFVAVLWVTVIFVMLAVRPFMPSGGVEGVCWIAAAILLLFNTTSIGALVRHYGDDKEHIYSIDIKHLDAGR